MIPSVGKTRTRGEDDRRTAGPPRRPHLPARLGRILGLTAALGMTVAPVGRADDAVLVLAGSASKPVLEAAAERIHEELGVRVELNLGGSGSMLSQLELAGRGDVYLPGSHDWLLRAVQRGLVDGGTRVDLAYLVPALVVPRGNPRRVETLAHLAREDVRAAIAEPRTVCVGEYAVGLLERAALGEVVDTAGRARSCAALAHLAALGSVDAIVGWHVFARWYPDRLEAVALPPELVTRVATISGAVTTAARDTAAARRVLAWLASPPGRELWREAGYLTDLEDVRALAPNATVGR